MGFFGPGMSTPRLARFCNHLAMSYGGGIPILRCVELTTGRSRLDPARHIAHSIHNSIERGATFAQAVHWERRRLPHFFVSMVAVGERGGKLNDCFEVLARYYDEMNQLRQEFWKQASYPIAVLITMWVFIPLLIHFLYSTATSEEVFILDAFRIIIRNLMPAFVVLTFFAIILRFRIMRRAMMKLLYYMPLAHPILRGVVVGKFAWAMALLERSYMAPHHALWLAGQSTGLPHMERALTQAAKQVRGGMPISQALDGVPALSRLERAQIGTGEEVGKLDTAFEQIGRGAYDKAVFIIRIYLILLVTLFVLGLGGMIILGYV